MSPSTTGPRACTTKDLTLKVEGPQRVTSGKTMQLVVSASAPTSCFVDLAKTPLELRIYSGTDRIWSTNDCADWQPRKRMSLGPETGWKHGWTWETKRSAPGCRIDRDEYLRPGTYVATVEIDGRTDQHVFQLVG